MAINSKKVILFTGLTFLVCWTVAILFHALGGRWNTPLATGVGVIYMFIPMMMAIVVQKLIYRQPLKEPFGISFKFNRWFIVAWLLPPVIAFAVFGISLLLPGVKFSPEMAGLMERFKSVLPPEQFNQMKNQIATFPIHPFFISLFQGLIAGFTINAVAGFGEELGWRGLLQKELEPVGFWNSSVLIGCIWGVWHAPLILQGHNYPQHPVAGVFMMIIWCMLLAPIFSFIRLKAKSVIAASIIHGSLNATAGLAIMLIQGGNDLTVGVTGAVGFIVLAIVNIGIFAYNRFGTIEPGID